MLRRIVFTRRYTKVIVFCFFLLFSLFVILAINKESTAQYLPVTVQDKLSSLNIGDYVNKLDYKYYLGGSASNETEYRDEDMAKSSNISSSVEDNGLWVVSGKFNSDFFYNFRFHNKKGSRRDTQNNNKWLYRDEMKKNVSEPKVNNLKRPSSNYELANATLVSLVRNSELDGIVSAMKEVEHTFNSKFHYPWTFINDDSFSAKFKETVANHTQSECFFVQIPKELWKKPAFIDSKIEAKKIKEMLSNSVGYADMESYHNMCRFYSGQFYNVPHLQKFKYYWRVEPDTNYYCDIGYDVFKFMEDNNKTYGFNINLYDGPSSISTLWNTTIDFLKQDQNYKYLHPNGAYDWLTEDMQNPDKNREADYSTCHFWSNFEIADMDFYRSEAYTKWFQHLDHSGGFYYERWGDAPIHAIGLGLFEDKSRIHWFKDIGYTHFPYTNCPNSDKCDGRCTPTEFVPWPNLEKENCMANWMRYGMSKDEKQMFS